MVKSVAAAAVGGLFSSAGAKKGSKAAEQASQLEAEVARENIALQREIYETGREDQTPYREMGYAALNRLGGQFGIRPQTTTTAPGIQRQTQGTLAPMPGGAGGVRAFAQNSDVLERFRGVMDPAGFEHLKYLLDTGQDTSAYDAMIGLAPGTLATSPGRSPAPQGAAPKPGSTMALLLGMLPESERAAVSTRLARGADVSDYERAWGMAEGAFSAARDADAVSGMGPLRDVSPGPAWSTGASSPAPVAPRTKTETSQRLVDDGSDPLDASQDQMRRLAAGFETSPGYQFRVQEGENALARAQGARGKLLSGEAMRELTQFGQGLASDEYGTYMNRATSAFGDYNNRLAALAGVGQSATQSGMQAGQQFGNTAGNILSQSGSNQANALLAGGAIRAGGMNNIGQGIQNAYSNYQFNNALSNMGRQNNSSMILPNFQPVTGTAGGSSLNFWPG